MLIQRRADGRTDGRVVEPTNGLTDSRTAPQKKTAVFDDENPVGRNLPEHRVVLSLNMPQWPLRDDPWGRTDGRADRRSVGRSVGQSDGRSDGRRTG